MAPVGLMVLVAVLYGVGTTTFEAIIPGPTMACQDCFDVMINRQERYERGESIEKDPVID